ncbi:MAG: OmpA family protein [Myxococcales bacterium]|nr:OmpA family protein [Myxococcales bacterium]
MRPTAPDRGALLVELVDPAGRPGAGATLRVGGVAVPDGAAGIVMLEDRPLGRVKLAAGAPGFRTTEADTVDVVRGTGARFALRPGTWQIVVSAKGFGPWHKDVEVVAALAAEKVELTHTSVVSREQVRFAHDKADIDEGSHPLLEQVASTLLLHTEIARIEVQGYADSRGAEIHNFDLSQRRAEAVRAFLLRRGVEADRVVAPGYGTARPLANNDTEAGRARNRRVQFELLPPP